MGTDGGERSGEGLGGGDPVGRLAQGVLAAYLAPVFVLVLAVGSLLLAVSGIAAAAGRLADRARPPRERAADAFRGPVGPALLAKRPATP